MKTRTIIPLWVLLATLAFAACSSDGDVKPGALYQKYAAHPGLTVAQVSDFALCDSVKTDVVLLVADDEESWLQLKEELDIRGDEGSVSWLGDMEAPARRMQWDGQPVLRVIASHHRHSVGLYRIDNEAQYDALMDYQLNNI